MSEIRHAGIAGTGHYVPERVIPNAFFEDFVDTSDEWIRQRTGIQERRFLADGQTIHDMCMAAARQALDAAGVEPDELDLIVLGTISADQYVPATAPLLQHHLGATRAAAFDISAACAGFLAAMNVGESFIASGKGDKVLIIGAEALSRYIDMKDRGSCILFGDGAGAAVLQAQEAGGPGEILRTALGSDRRRLRLHHYSERWLPEPGELRVRGEAGALPAGSRP